MKRETYIRRMNQVQERMKEQRIDCLMVGPSASLRYLTGYSGRADERLLVLVLAPEKKPFILANKLYELQLNGAPVEEFIFWEDGEDAVELLAQTLDSHRIQVHTAAVDKSMPGLFLVPISERLSHARFLLAGDLVDGLRVYKDAEEMERMRQACQWATVALENTISLGSYWIGRTESDFRDHLNREMTAQGLNAHGAIVAVGANAAIPHHFTGQTVIESGKCMLVDYGANCEGYCSDMTRTFFFGEPSDEFKAVYEIVREANRRGREAARIGNPLEEVDRAARNYIEEKGYGSYFTHRTGHGIGLEGHEGPSAAEGVKVLIQPGMAFSIEPGIYLPGKFGVRIEDQALIAEDGLHILHDFSRELLVIR